MQLQNNSLIVYPSSRAIRETIKQNKNKQFLPSYLTIDEFLNKSIKLNGKKYLDEESRFLYLKEALEKINIEKLGLSKDFFTLLKDSNYLFRFFGEVSSEKIDINLLEEFDTYEFFNEHIQVLKEIYEQYKKILDKNKAVDKINLKDNYHINEKFIKRFESIKIYYEGYFTKYEFDLINEISSLTEVIIEFTALKYNNKSLAYFLKEGFEFKNGNSYEIDLSKKTIISSKEYNSICKDINIASFLNPINQIAYIKKAITESIEKGVEASKIVLIVPDESVIDTLQLFDVEKYFNYAMGKSVKNTVFYKMLLSAYNFLNENDELKYQDGIVFYGLDKDFLEEYRKKFLKITSKDDIESFFEYLFTINCLNELKEKVNELLYKFEYLVFKQNESLSLKQALKILLQNIAKLSLDDVNSGPITVMGLLESRAVSYETVIICDFNESKVPKKSIKDKFLSSKLKSFVNLPTSSDRENLQKYYYSKLINEAKKVYISYVNSQSDQISRFASDIFKDIKIDENPKDKLYSRILFKNTELKHFDEKIVETINLSKRVWSASSLKLFLECKRKFYLKYIAKIDEHIISLKPRAYELGNLIHKVLEKLYKENSILEINYEKIKEYLDTELLQNPFLILEKEVFLKKLDSFIKLEEKRFKKNIKVIGLEKDFLFEYDGIKLKGTIDRIDLLDDYYEVIDYKTSSNLKVDSKKSYENTSEFQLEFYYLACEKLYKTDKIKTFYYDLYKGSLVEEITLDEKLKLLDEILQGFKTQKEVEFSKCEKTSTCQFCEYKTICNR